MAAPGESRHHHWWTGVGAPETVARVERRLAIARLGAIGWGLLLVVTGPASVSQGRALQALAVVAAFGAGAAGLFAASRRVRTARQARGLGVASWAVDAVTVTAIVLLFAEGSELRLWSLLVLLPVEGGVRFQLPGALVGWVGAAVATIAVSGVAGGSLHAHPLLYRLGLLLVLAVIVGGMSTAQQHSRREAEEALDELRRLEHWRGQMVSTLGHDVRSPIATVEMLAGTLRDHGHELDERARADLADRIRRQSRRLQRLAADLLDMARLDRDGFVLHPRVTALGEVIELAALDVSSEVEVEVPDDLRLRVDPDRLGQVVANLVGNATRHGQPPVRVAAEPRAGGVEILVEDHGPGIPDEDRGTLFDAFSSGYAPDSIGLGLWIVRTIVEAHGGTVGYEPNEPRGARFVVWLPDADASPPEGTPP